jgi:hypothetical protein
MSDFHADGLAALKAIRKYYKDPNELDICFQMVRESIQAEQAYLEANPTRKPELEEDLAWKEQLCDEFSYDLSPEWIDAAIAMWSLTVLET